MTKHATSKVRILAGAVVCLVTVVVALGSLRARSQAPPAPLAQPQQRVGFSADLMTTQPDGPQFSGRLYRSSDGSHREDGYLTGDGKKLRFIGITNYRVNRQYVFREDKSADWFSAPVRVSLREPSQYRLATREYSGLVEEADAFSGLKVFRQTTANGDYSLLAPALNFYPVLVQTGRGGMRRALSQIEIAEPPAEMFLPPPDVQIREVGAEVYRRHDDGA